VYEGKRDDVTVATLSRWSQSGQLKTEITAIIKYTENLLRRQRAFKGTLRGIDLASEWAALLDAAFLQPVLEAAPKKRRGKVAETLPEAPMVDTPITIDFEKVSVLRNESDEVRQRLTVEDEETAVEAVLPPAVQEPVVTVELVSAFNVERPANTPAHLLTNLREVAETTAGDETAIYLLRYLRAEQWESSNEAAQAAVGSEFLSVVLDRINERAIESIGDNLIFAEGNQLVVAEDYRDELDYLLPQTVESITATAEHEAVVPVVHYENLTEEWEAFVRQMKPHHWEALNALIIGEDVEMRLDGIARSVYTTLDLLVDELNEFALESVGDNIIETGGAPRIEDEDIDSLRSLTEWALTNVRQE
jgi:hypothetical protein